MNGNYELITLPIGGFYRFRAGAEKHSFEATSVHMLQSAVTNDNYNLYKKYSEVIKENQPINVRDLLDFNFVRKSISLEEIENTNQIRKRLI